MAAMAVMRNLPAPRIHLIDAGVRKNKYAARTLRRKPAEPKWRRKKMQKRTDDKSESNAATEEPQEPTHPLTPVEEKEARKKEKKEKEREEEEADMVTLENGERESRDVHRLRRLFFRLCFCRDLCECVIANFGGIFWCTLIIVFSLFMLGVGNITIRPLRKLYTFLDALHKFTGPLRTVVGGVIKGIGAVVGGILGIFG